MRTCTHQATILGNYVTQELCLDDPNFARPIIKMLNQLSYNGETIVLNASDNDYMNQMNVESGKMNRSVNEDDKFWSLLNRISEVLMIIHESLFNVFVKKKQLFGIYAALEKANLEFVQNSCAFNGENGYGSDSECELSGEDIDEEIKVRCRKVTVKNGMRAICLAQFVAENEWF